MRTGSGPRGTGVLAFLAISLALLMVLPSLTVLADPGSRGLVNNTDSEPNDTYVEATVIDLASAVISGSLGLNDQDDLYKVQLDANDMVGDADRLTVHVEFDTMASEPGATIVDPWGFVLDHRLGSNITLEVVAAPDLKGYFYIHLQARAGSTSYTLWTDVVTEPFTYQDLNNHPSTAVPIGPTNPDMQMGDLWADEYGADYQDFYKVELTAGGTSEPAMVSAYLEPSVTGNYRLELYDSYLNLLAEYRHLADPIPGQPQVLTYLTTGTGDHYLRVWAANGTGDYVLTTYSTVIPNLKDGDLAHATELTFGDLTPHERTIMDGLGHNTYPGVTDDADVWSMDIEEGQFVRGTVTSLLWDQDTALPRMRVDVYDEKGSPYPFNRSGDGISSVIEPMGMFDLTGTSTGTIFIKIGLDGAASGGGGYRFKVETDRVPEVAGDPVIDVTITDEGPVALVDLDELFDDPDRDDLSFIVSVDDPEGVRFHENVEAGTDQDNVLVLTAWPRFEGSGTVTVIAHGGPYVLKKELTYHVTVESCGCHIPEIRNPYDVGNSVPEPVVLEYNVKETDTSLVLSNIFRDGLGKDPLGTVLEYSVEGDIVARQWYPGSDPCLKKVVTRDGVTVALENNCVHSGHPVQVTIGLTEEVKEEGPEFETIFWLVAWPVVNDEERTPPVEVVVRVTRGSGNPPSWDLPAAFEMDEDEELVIDLDPYIEDEDIYDKGALEYTVTMPDLTVAAVKVDRGTIRFVPGTDWCGMVEGIRFRAMDTYGWEVEEVADLKVRCVNDGPEVVLMAPPGEQAIEVFEGEEVPLTVLVTDPDTGTDKMVYDWYINEHPLEADGNNTYRFVAKATIDDENRVKVVVTNRETGMSTWASWDIVVKRINQAPLASIQVKGHPDRTHMKVNVGDRIWLIGTGLDPEGGALNYTWDFGDGGTSVGPQADHVYSGTGDYVVTLIVSDGEFSTYAHIDVTVTQRTTIVAAPETIDLEFGMWFGIFAILIMVVGLSATEPGKFRIFLFLAILYSKIKKTKVLDHYIRGRIQGYITANPGAHYNMIKTDLQINNGNLAYHLSVLERQGYLKSLKDGIYKRFYPDTMKVVRPPSLQERILVLLRNHPGLTQKDIAIKLDESQSTVNDYIRRMSTANLLRVERVGVRNRCFIKEG